jgi:hypothetical protein
MLHLQVPLGRRRWPRRLRRCRVAGDQAVTLGASAQAMAAQHPPDSAAQHPPDSVGGQRAGVPRWRPPNRRSGRYLAVVSALLMGHRGRGGQRRSAGPSSRVSSWGRWWWWSVLGLRLACSKPGRTCALRRTGPGPSSPEPRKRFAAATQPPPRRRYEPHLSTSTSLRRPPPVARCGWPPTCRCLPLV